MKKMIETERLYLREMNCSDHEALGKIISDPVNMSFYVKPYDEKGVDHWIEWCMNSYRENGFGLWALCLKENDEMIGDCGISMQNIDGEILPEIGFHIRYDMHNKGYGHEAALAVRDWGFNNKDFPALYSYCTSDNVASYKTAESIGMHYLKEFETDGVMHRVSIIRKEDWSSRNGK